MTIAFSQVTRHATGTNHLNGYGAAASKRGDRLHAQSSQLELTPSSAPETSLVHPRPGKQSPRRRHLMICSRQLYIHSRQVMDRIGSPGVC